MDETHLTPAEARARFGELRGMARAHREFETPEGLWRPVFDADVELTGYQFYPRPKKLTKKVVWRPRGKR